MISSFLVLVFAIFVFILEKTTFGRRIYATGSNWKSAKLAGVNIDLTKMAAYAISGCMAAVSGLILLSRLGSAQPTLGDGYELDAIAAVALGGTSMNGGREYFGCFFLLSGCGKRYRYPGGGYVRPQAVKDVAGTIPNQVNRPAAMAGS